MPTECERNSTLPSNNLESRMDKELDEMAASATNGHGNNSGTKISVTSPDPTSYVARARVTRPIPPKPSCNPMQFVQIKPCNLYQSAQQQLKKAEEVKKVKEIKKEEPEDWQNNLDNWKSSRRKRVEHIIDRVVEVKKLELEEHDRGRRKSKTFSEMIEERGDRPGRGRVKLASLAVYNEDESNDLSDLGIGTSSASGKSSLSEDYDNNSVISDNADIEKVLFDNSTQGGTSREYISSPGYDTSSSTAPASSPDPCEYTYEGAIQDYKTRVSRATSGSNSYKTNNNNIDVTSSTSKESQNDCSGGIGTMIASYQPRRGSKIEDRLMGFEVTSPNDTNDNSNAAMLKMDLPKIDILKRKEIFENHTTPTEPQKSQGATVSNSKSRLQQSGDQNGLPKTTLKDRINDVEGKITSSSTQDPHSSAYTTSDEKNDIRRLSGGGEMTSIKDRLQSLEQNNLVNAAKSTAAPKIVDVTVPPLRDRLSSLQNAVTKEDVKKSPVCLVDARQLEIMKNEEEKAKLKLKGLKEEEREGVAEIKTENVIDRQSFNEPPPSCQVFNEHHENNTITSNSTSSDTTIMEVLADRDDSGIQTADDISYSQLDDSENVHQAISENEERPSESSQDHHITLPNQKTEQNINKDEPKMTSLPAVVLVDHPSSEMEFSVSSASNIDSFSNENCNNCGKSSCAKCSNSTDVDKKNVDVVVGVTTPVIISVSDKNNQNNDNRVNHAQNLLKMFNETFKSGVTEIENDVEVKKESQSNDCSLEKQNPTLLKPSTDVDSSKSPSNTLSQVKNCEKSLIPRSVISGKPPMSPPRSIRSPSPKRNQIRSPFQSPIASKKDSAFNINGRVEIFNSKNMQTTTNVALPQTQTISSQRQQSSSSSPSSSSKSQVNAIGKPPLRNKSNLPHSNDKQQQVYHIGTRQEQKTDRQTDDDRATIELPSQPSLPSATIIVSTKQSSTSMEAALTELTEPLNASGAAIESSYSPTTIECRLMSGDTTTITTDEIHSTSPPPSPPKVEVVPMTSLSKMKCETSIAKPSTLNPTQAVSGVVSSSLPLSTSPVLLASSSSLHPVSYECCSPSTNDSEGGAVTLSESETPKVYTPNESSLWKIVSSKPSSSSSGDNGISKILDDFDKPTTNRQQTVEEIPCDKIDVRNLPPNNTFIVTPCIDVSTDAIERCDGRSSSAPSSPALARAINMKILKETCDKLVASGQNLASKSPLLQRKRQMQSKIPKLSSNDISQPLPASSSSPATSSLSPDEGILIARLEVVETKIKVTTQSPPTSPKVNHTTHPNNNNPKKTKNIFDFLKKNFHHDDATTNSTRGATSDESDTVTVVDNSKFYIPVCPDDSAQLPTAPVNIEITKTITTDEILDESNSDLALSSELSEMLDDEISKLTMKINVEK